MLNSSIYSVFERMWQHVLTKCNDYIKIDEVDDKIASLGVIADTDDDGILLFNTNMSTDVSGSVGSTNAVLYTAQNLTEEQKAQARENIGVTGNGSGGNVDLTGYATEQFVRDGYQPKGDYLESTALTGAVNDALAQAKASGQFDGKDGVDGKDGQDGYTPQKGIDYFDGQPGKDGVDGKDGYTPVKGVDYWTDADKEEIVDLIIAALGGQPLFGRVDGNNNIMITATLADGVYTLKYEYEDGTTADIGTVTVGGEDTPTVIDITWNNGYKCSYTVGTSYPLVADASYLTSDVIEVESGASYKLTINNNTKETKFRVIGADSSGIVTEILIDNATIAVGNNTYTFTPSIGTTQIRLRTYVDAHILATWVLTKE